MNNGSLVWRNSDFFHFQLLIQSVLPDLQVKHKIVLTQKRLDEGPCGANDDGEECCWPSILILKVVMPTGTSTPLQAAESAQQLSTANCKFEFHLSMSQKSSNHPNDKYSSAHRWPYIIVPAWMSRQYNKAGLRTIHDKCTDPQMLVFCFWLFVNYSIPPQLYVLNMERLLAVKHDRFKLSHDLQPLMIDISFIARTVQVLVGHVALTCWVHYTKAKRVCGTKKSRSSANDFMACSPCPCCCIWSVRMIIS